MNNEPTKQPSAEYFSARTLEARGSCSKCHYVLPRLVDCAPKYFEHGYIICEQCGANVDLWQAALSRAKALSFAPWSLVWLGATQTSLAMEMKTGNYYEISLMDHGAPPDAKILSTNYTSQGGDNGAVTSLEWHGNTPRRRVEGTTLRLFAIPLGEGPEPRAGRVAISVVWIRGDESDAWPYLTTAFESAAAREYAPSMVFAQSAVEISMMPVIKQRLWRHAATDRVENFMKDSLTYSHALNVLLPYMSAELGARKMPDEVRGALNKMRKKRNDIIHEGAKVAAVTPEDAMEGLCAAAFGFEYMRYVGPTLLEGKKMTSKNSTPSSSPRTSPTHDDERQR